MPPNDVSAELARLKTENDELRRRLDEAEEMLRAIRHGEIDALVVQTDRGEQLFTLQAAERPYRVIVETMNEGAVSVRVDGLILYCNDAFERIVGAPVGQVMGRSLFDFAAADQRPRLASLFQRSVRGATKERFDFIAASGLAVPVYISANPVTGGDDAIICTVVTDLTEIEEGRRKLVQRAAQLRALVAELAQTEEREKQRLARVLHDGLQQLLVAAKFSASVLVRRAADDNAKAEAQRVFDFLAESIEMSRSLTTELSPPALAEGGLAAGLPWLGQWMRDKHGLEVAMTISAPPTPLPRHLRLTFFQAVRELLFNVVKHAGVRRAQVQVSHDDGKSLRVIVVDDGRGFDAERVDAAGANTFGLFHVSERMAMLDGRTEIDSAPGRGARITLTAPIPPATPASPAATAPNVIRVLVADDHAVLRKGLTELIQRDGDLVVVGEAADGRQAVELTREQRPDVVLMDVAMPVMDGVEATRRIAAEMPAVRVIGLSMDGGTEAAAHMRAAGAVRYIAKDRPVEEVVAAIREVARK